jgi:predicted acylesterase/phospholipase RssA/CRP-like cAMP-binding protein
MTTTSPEAAPKAPVSTLPTVSFAELARVLDSPEGKKILALCQKRHVQAGDVICRLDGEPDGMYLIVSGQVASYKRASTHQPLPVEIQHVGDLFAAFALQGDTRISMRVRAITDTDLLLFPKQVFGGKQLPHWPGLQKAVLDFGKLAAGKRAFAEALRSLMVFSDASFRYALQLVKAADLLEIPAGTTLFKQGDKATALYYVARGELRVSRNVEGVGEVLIQYFKRGAIAGTVAVTTGLPEFTTVFAEEPATLIAIPIDEISKVIQASPALMRAMGSEEMRPKAGAGFVTIPPSYKVRGQVTLLTSDEPGAPLSALTELLAMTLVNDFQDHVVVVRPVKAPAGTAPAAPKNPGLSSTSEFQAVNMQGGVLYLDVPIPDGADAAPILQEALHGMRHRHDFVFLDLMDRGPELRRSLAPFVGKLIHLSRNPLDARVPPEFVTTQTLYTALLDPPPSAPLPPNVWRKYPYGTVRVRLDLRALAGLRPDDTALARLSAQDREAFSRWGRAVSERRVGIALGGGGSYGFAHVALMRAMRAAGIPIDMVSGTSFGSVVGAFYCAAGLPGLDYLVEKGGSATPALLGGYLSSELLALWVQNQVRAIVGNKKPTLQDLEVPLFPVSTDISDGTEFVLSVGTLGDGVRTSGAFPVAFTPVTYDDGTRCVDGGFINNVPASVLVPEGADLIIASNSIATPHTMLSQPMFKGTVGRLLHEFNPFERAADVLRAAFVLFHTNGDRECELAQVTFVPDPILVSPSNWSAGKRICDKAAPQVEEAMDQIKSRWTQMTARHAIP